ncbi:unnamed protein product [Rhizopus microsporus]
MRDPYRTTRKQNDSSKYEQDEFNSKSPSESSMTRLSAAPKPVYQEDYDYYQQQDPYAPNRQKKKKKKTNMEHYYDSEKRANSYLPYSHHKRDPYDPVEPIYLDEELPSFNSPGHRGPVGSILQDNIAMEMVEQDDLHNSTPHKNINSTIQPLTPTKKKRWWTRLGISGRKLVFIVFAFVVVIVVVWYFVWPRTPTLQYQSAAYDGPKQNTTDNTIVANWKVNFTVLNNDNWIPTNIENFAVTVIDASTGVQFGHGNSGHLMLRPRSIDQVITIPIQINYTSSGPNDNTFQDLYSACVVKVSDPNSTNQSLNIKFRIVYYIAGIVWHTIAIVAPTTNYFQCPNAN